MIASLQGQVIAVEEGYAVLGIGGVGFQVYVPAPLLDELQVGEGAFFHIELVVREDSLTMFGFATDEARKLFKLLMGVSGIGPRLALAILSTLTPESIRRAVFHEQPEVFSRVPGVGRKTAQKIQFHLQDRLPEEEGLAPISRISDVDTEVLEALTALGYSVVEAQAAIQSLPRDTPEDVELRLRTALQYFTT